MTIIIETDRLILRTWKDKDIKPYFLINQDPKVIEFLGGALTMEQVQDFIKAQNIQYQERNYALWAAELKESGEMIGFIGLHYVDWEAHFTPAIEIGWRLGSQYWGNGYATEGAKACLSYGFNKIGLREIIAITVPANVRSRRVMEKLGLKRDMGDDFVHPELPHDHHLSQHVLYRLAR